MARERGLTFRSIPSSGISADQLLSDMQAMRGKAIEKAYVAGKARLPLFTTSFMMMPNVHVREGSYEGGSILSPRGANNSERYLNL